MEQLVYSPRSLGSAIRRQRKLLKLSQKEAGHPFSLEQSTVSSIEHGKEGTRLETLFRILSALDLEMVIRSKPKSKNNKESMDVKDVNRDEDW